MILWFLSYKNKGICMKNSHRRHDISDKIWNLLEPHLPGRPGVWGGRAKDNRLFINAVFWILRTGAPWRDLPPDYGSWKNTHRRFCRWRDKGTWEALLEKLVNNPDFEWLMIDASHIKVHPHGSGAKGGNQEMGRTKGGSIQSYIWPWMRLVCRSELLLRQVPLLIAQRLSA
jgi:transposase